MYQLTGLYSLSFVPHKQRRMSSAQESQNHRQKQQLYRSRSGRDTRYYVVYYLNDYPTPFAQRIKDRNFTLGDFKTKVFLRKGKYR